MRAVSTRGKIKSTEQRLVSVHLCKAAPGERINSECRYAKLIKLSRPNIDVCGVTTGPVLEQDNRQTAGPLRNTKLTGNCHRLAADVALKELLIGECQRLNLVQFGSRSDLFGCNLKSQSGGQDDEEREDRSDLTQALHAASACCKPSHQKFNRAGLSKLHFVPERLA